MTTRELYLENNSDPIKALVEAKYYASMPTSAESTDVFGPFINADEREEYIQIAKQLEPRTIELPKGAINIRSFITTKKYSSTPYIGLTFDGCTFDGEARQGIVYIEGEYIVKEIIGNAVILWYAPNMNF